MRLGFALVLALTACSPAVPSAARTIPVGEAGAPPSTSSTTRTAYDDAFAKMETRVRENRDGGACFVAEHGTCGDLAYIEEMPGGLMGEVRYFDASGALVSTQHFNIDHGGSQSWDGPVQSCGRKKVRDLCEK